MGLANPKNLHHLDSPAFLDKQEVQEVRDCPTAPGASRLVGYVIDFLTGSSKSHVGMAMWRNASHSATEGSSCDGNNALSQTDQHLNCTHELASCYSTMHAHVIAVVLSHCNSRQNNQWHSKNGSNDAQDHERCNHGIRWSL